MVNVGVFFLLKTSGIFNHDFIVIRPSVGLARVYM